MITVAMQQPMPANEKILMAMAVHFLVIDLPARIMHNRLAVMYNNILPAARQFI